MKKLLVANWKENPETEREALELFGATARAVHGKKIDMVVCPPFIYLEKIGARIKKIRAKNPSRQNKVLPPPLGKGEGAILLGAQDIFWEEGGPYTGEVGPKMLKQFGVRYVIIGHSERRWLGETDEMINQKIARALKSGLRVILCVGESALVRRQGLSAAKQFVAGQLKKDLKGISLATRHSPLATHLLIAYEPIWAIGTGRNDPPDDARKMAMFIKKTVVKILHSPLATRHSPLLLYGGSVNSRDIMNYVQYEEIDGALVGGASLKAHELKAMVALVTDHDTLKK